LPKIRKTILIGSRVANVLLLLDKIDRPVTYQEFMKLTPYKDKYVNREAIKRMWVSGWIKIYSKRMVLSQKALDVLKEMNHPGNIIEKEKMRWFIRVCHG
jgi:predicted acetyltransferase